MDARSGNSYDGGQFVGDERLEAPNPLMEGHAQLRLGLVLMLGQIAAQ